MMIEKSVYKSFIGFSISPIAIMALLMIPLLPRILIHAKLRITEFVIIGKIDAERSSPLHFLSQRLMKYAVGIPPTIQTKVVMTAIFTVLKKIFL